MRQLLILVFLGLSGWAFCDDHIPAEWHGCGPLQRLKVLQQWAAIQSTGNDRTEFGMAVFRAYFSKNPEYEPIYIETTKQEDDYNPHYRATIAGSLSRLNTLITLLSDEKALQQQAKYIHGLHEKHHLPHDAMWNFGTALAHVIPARLGRCFDFDAWNKCYSHITYSVRQHD